MRFPFVKCLAFVCTCVGLGLALQPARGQTFRYQPRPRAGDAGISYTTSDPAPRLMMSSDAAEAYPPRTLREYRDPRFPRRMESRFDDSSRARPTPRRRDDGVLLTAQGETLAPKVSVQPFVEDAPPGPPGSGPEDYGDGTYVEGPMDPQLDGGPFLSEPSCGGCGQCDQCAGRCYMKRAGDCLRCAAARGAFCENWDLFTGKQGFKGPVDQGVNGDFGFHVGANWAFPLVDRWGLGYQIGGNLVLSDFEGHSGPLEHRRSQFFVTSGLFHRAVCGNGLQGGAVLDYLRDDFYIQMDMVQIRAEVSYLYCYHEVGFWGAFHTNTSTHLGSFSPDEPLETFSFQANNQYNLFYRYQFCNGTFCRTWMGLSGHGDGIFGSDATVYISQRLGLVATYNYLLPRNDPTIPNNVKESWNLTISMVWYPGYRCPDSWHNPYRPLFYVADNGWMLQREAN